MPDILIRNVPVAVAAALRGRAKRSGRSIQAEALAALERAVEPSGSSFHAKVRAFHEAGLKPFDANAAVEALLVDRAR